MKGSLHLATVSGIPVKIHWTFGLLLLYVVFDTGRGGLDPWLILFSVAVVLSFASSSTSLAMPWPRAATASGPTTSS